MLRFPQHTADTDPELRCPTQFKVGCAFNCSIDVIRPARICNIISCLVLGLSPFACRSARTLLGLSHSNGISSSSSLCRQRSREILQRQSEYNVMQP